MPRYPLDGADRLQAHLRALTGRADIAVSRRPNFAIVGLDAAAATAAQWAVIQQLQVASARRRRDAA